jgi:dolichol-phosphate mannosyltransferase
VDPVRVIWLLLPAYDEEENLPALLRDVAAVSDRMPLRVVVVDDGSRDGTAAAATSVPGVDVVLLRHGRNRGLGAAMRTGIEHVLAHGTVSADPAEDDLLATMDADHTHPVELLPGMVARARAGADLVIASRYQPGAEIHGLGPFRRSVSRVASVVMQALFPGARDYTCGYRVYRLSLLAWGKRRWGPALLNQPGFSVMVDLLLKLRRGARRIEEVPLVLRYDRKRGVSKMKVARTAWVTLRLLARRFRGDPTGP